MSAHDLGLHQIVLMFATFTSNTVNALECVGQTAAPPHQGQNNSHSACTICRDKKVYPVLSTMTARSAIVIGLLNHTDRKYFSFDAAENDLVVLAATATVFNVHTRLSTTKVGNASSK